MSRQPTGIRSTRLCRLSALLVLPALVWAAETRNGNIPCKLEISPAHNSTHQRLVLGVTVTVDGRDLEKRRGQGELKALVQFEDMNGRTYRSRAALNLEAVREGIRRSDVQINQYVFILPGDYTVSVSLYDTATLEHGLASRRVHVGPLKDDPLPGAWQNLPAVEFVHAARGSPDGWYLPDVESRLHLPVATRRPVYVELVVNETPSERQFGSTTARRRNLSLLIPSLKIFAGMRLEQGEVDAALLDLTQQKVVWEQRNIGKLDWTGLRQSIQQEQPGKIDVHALERQQSMAAYFGGEVDRRLRARESGPCVVVVLSGPAFLQDQEPVGLPAGLYGPERAVIYIRQRSIFAPPLRRDPRIGLAPPPGLAYQQPMPVDDLERALLPLNPRIYDAATPEQFRQILAKVIQQIEAM